MAKIGRNDPCSCGSAKKYKRCCLAVDQAAQAATRTPPDPESSQVPPPFVLDDFDEIEELTRLSNGVLDLIEERRLDEAEERCEELRTRFPEASDGIERLGHVYEVRGDLTTAAAHYRKAATFIRESGVSGDEHAIWLDQLADRIDPP